MKKLKAENEAKQEAERLAAVLINPIIAKWEGSWPKRRAKAIERRETPHDTHILTFATTRKIRRVQVAPLGASK